MPLIQVNNVFKSTEKQFFFFLGPSLNLNYFYLKKHGPDLQQTLSTFFRGLVYNRPSCEGIFGTATTHAHRTPHDISDKRTATPSETHADRSSPHQPPPRRRMRCNNNSRRSVYARRRVLERTRRIEKCGKKNNNCFAGHRYCYFLQWILRFRPAIAGAPDTNTNFISSDYKRLQRTWFRTRRVRLFASIRRHKSSGLLNIRRFSTTMCCAQGEQYTHPLTPDCTSTCVPIGILSISDWHNIIALRS